MALADMFLLIEGQKTGKINGGSADAAHHGHIDLLDWSWGMATSGSMGGAGDALKTSLSEITLVKGVDSASTALMSVMRNGEIIKKGVLSVRKSGGRAMVYLTVTFERARITSYSLASQSGPELVERLSVAFEKIEIQHFSQDEKGAKKGGSTFNAEVRAL